MRNFNTEEKEILELIVYDSKKEYVLARDRKRISVYDLLEKMAKDLKVQIDIDRKEKKLVLRSDKFGYRLKDGKELPIIYENWGEHLHNAFYKIEEKIVVIISLLDYLEKHHLIYIFPLEERNLDSIKLNKDFVFEIPDYIPSYGNFINVVSSKFDYIYENLFDSIISTPELIEFVEKDFKDKEQIRHEENVLLQRKSQEQADKSTKAATKLGWISTVIAFFSFIAAIASLMPENRRQQWFGISKKDEPVKQCLKESNPDTVKNKQKQIVIKESLTSDTLKSKSISPNSLKK